jgi:enoyl-CoA hydratase/carnithine racemase
MNEFEFDQITVNVEGGVAVVALNRPEHLNAWTATMGRELSHALRVLDADADVRVIVLTGAGRAFCAGADLGGGASTFDSERRPDPDAREPLTLPWQLHTPVIAAINGHAIGVGITLPLTADVRYIAEDAKVQFAFVRRGVVPELSSHVILPRVVGLSNAADLLLSGRIFTGREAADRGLASVALPAAEVLSAAVAWARDVAVNAAPTSVAAAKRLLWDDVIGPVERMSRLENKMFAWAGHQPDAKEGVMAFLERRPPAWQNAMDDLPEID